VTGITSGNIKGVKLPMGEQAAAGVELRKVITDLTER